MTSLALILCLAFPTGSLRAAPASDYPARLASALLTRQAPPPVVRGSEDLGREAAELLQGREPGTEQAAHDRRVYAFCLGLPLDKSQREDLFRDLRQRVRTAVPGAASPVAGRRLDPRQAAALHGRALDMALALGRPNPVEAVPGRLASQGPVLLPPGHSPAPIPLRELETWVQFGEKRLFGGPDPSEDFSRKIIMRMQETPEGREVLAELRDEYARAGRKLLIAARDFAGSSIVERDGMEGIRGIRGMSYMNGAYRFNKKFMEFKDQETAFNMLCGNMAHELRHLVSHAMVKRLSPEADRVYGQLMLDEQRARLTGYLVAARLNKGRANDYTEEAKELAADPDAYWDDLKLGTSYATFFTTEDLRAPVKAYRDRLDAVERKRGIVEEGLRGLPKTGAQLEILETREGLRARLTELRSQHEARVASWPRQLKMYDIIIRQLKLSLADFSSSRGSDLLARLQAALDDPVIKLVEDGFRRDQRALVGLAAGRGFPAPKPVPGQITWAEFDKLVAKSQAEHPQYWREYFSKFGR